ncbi:spore germination protein GerPB [Paenibacillus pinihumi]|uniref:spore germination protein GerPB n=1 Tax=Paenibacillus pinihumi TaxID=669462 RepID=UPI0003F5A8CD|nr:spore germination protein GerPB [Paenibacillus pinihumi]
MTFTVYQHITIGQLRVENVSNSSVLQVGSSGSIRALSQLFNTGGFTEPAPQLGAESPLSFVPLPSPT